MNAFPKCRNTSDVVPLYLPQQLYLKPLAQISITVKLPEKLVGKTISNWELMEKLKGLIKPDEFSVLRATKSTLEYILFEAEIDDKTKIDKIVVKIHNKLIRLADFNDLFKVKAFESKQDFPNQHIWDSFFRETTDMDERKPGERPDTVHISNLPIRWFVLRNPPTDDPPKPSEKILKRCFEKFGRIRNIDIPICDPYRKQMKSYMSGLQTFSFDEKEFFEAYVQFRDYQGFVKAMDALRGMKLLHKDEDTFENYTVGVKVDFDRTKHMTDASIKRREIVRERFVRRQKQKEAKERLEEKQRLKNEEREREREHSLKEEKERRRREREERRKAKILEQLKNSEADEINAKIAKEEKKLLKAQRKLEAIRLVEELFKRIKAKREDDLTPMEKNKDAVTELSKYKLSSEKVLQDQRNKLHKAIESRIVLKTVLNKSKTKIKEKSTQSDSDTSLSPDEGKTEGTRHDGVHNNFPIDANVYLQNGLFPYVTPIYPDVRSLQYYPYLPRGRGNSRGQGTSRGFRNFRYRGRGRNFSYYPPEVQDQYYRYFNKFLHRSSRDRSCSRSPLSRSRSRSRSRRRSRRSQRSYSRSRSESYRSQSRSRSRRRSRSRSSTQRRRERRSDSRGRRPVARERRPDSAERRSKSVDSSKFLSPRSLKQRKGERSEPRSEWSKTPSPRK